MTSTYSPETKADDWRHKNLEEASKNTRGIFYLYLGALAYCFLTVVGTTDRQLLLGERAQLPIANIGVSLFGFFIVAPILLMLVYIYLQLYLQRMNGLKRQIRSSGGWGRLRPYPWLINIADDPEDGLVGRTQRTAVALMLWWSLPVVLQVFYLWMLKRHDEIMSVALFYESALGMALCGFCFHRENQRLFQRSEVHSLLFYWRGSDEIEYVWRQIPFLPIPGRPFTWKYFQVG